MSKRNIIKWIEDRNLTEEQKLDLLSRKNIQKYNITKNEIVKITKTFEKDMSRNRVIANSKQLGLSKLQVCRIAQGFLYEKSKRKFIDEKTNQGYTPTYLVKVIESFKYDKNKLKYIMEKKNKSIYGMQKKKIIDSLQTENAKKEIIEHAQNLELQSGDLASIISTFKYDSNKKIYLSREEIERHAFSVADLTKIISSIKDDNTKKQILDSSFVKDNSLKKINLRNILQSIKDENIKADYLRKNTFKLPILSQVKIISEFNNDKIKKDCLKQVERAKIKKSTKIASNIKLLLSMSDSENVLKALNEIEKMDSDMSKYRDIIMLGMFQDKEHLSEKEIGQLERGMGVKSNIEPPEVPSDMKIGIELEAIGKNRRGANNAVLLKKIRNLAGNYTAKNDTSLKGPNESEGVEIVSPILQKDDLKTIPIITKLMQRSGLTTNETCGGHIHIGADYLDTVEAARNFEELYTQNEELFYKIANPAGQKMREGIGTYAKPISNKIDLGRSILLKNEKDLDKFIENIKKIEEKKYTGMDRYHGLNLTNLNSFSKNTYEFRVFNGTLNPKDIFDNIKLCSRIMIVSKQLGNIEIALKNGERITEKQREMLNKKNHLMAKVGDEEQYANEFIDLLFNNEKDRKTFKERYKKAPKEEIAENFKEKEFNVSNYNQDQSERDNNSGRRRIGGIFRIFPNTRFRSKKSDEEKVIDIIDEYLR